MPSVIEAPETLQEIQEQPSCEAVQPIPAPRSALASKITALLRAVAIYLRPPIHQHWQEQPSTRAQEMPIDILVRKHPYLYIEALSG